MAEGFTSSFNPETGERRETRFEYVPVPEMQQELVSPTQMSETYKYFLSKTNNPKAAIEAANLVLDAAKQFKGRMLYKQAEQQGKLDDRRRAELAEDMYARNSGDIYNLARARKATMPPQINPNAAASLEFRKQQAALPPKPLYRAGPGGSTVRINPQDSSVETLVKGTDPAEAFQRRLDQDEYRSWFEQANGAKQTLSSPNVSPEARTRLESVLKRSEDEMAKIRSKWQPSTSTATNAPAPLSAEVAKTAPAPFREGQEIRNKKTGQLGVWRNGKIVPLEKTDASK